MCSKSRNIRFMDFPLDVIRLVQDNLSTATTRLRLQSLIPEDMRAIKYSDSTLSLIEYCHKRGILVESVKMMNFLFARPERSANDIIKTMAGYPALLRKKNLEADIRSEKLRDPSELPNALDIYDDFLLSYHTIHSLGDRSVRFFNELVVTDMFGHMKNKYLRGGILLHEQICMYNNDALFDRVKELAEDDPWFVAREKNFQTEMYEIKRQGLSDVNYLEIFKKAVSEMNMSAVRTLWGEIQT